MNAKAKSLFGGGGGHRKGGFLRDMSPRRMGVVAVGIALLVVFAAFHQDQLSSLVTPHDTVKVEFPRQYKLVFNSPFKSEVKIAGVVVGKVGDVERTDRDTALVTLEVQKGTLAKLGNAPSAAIVAKLVVAGNYYVELTPGGTGDYQGDVIPPERTRLPVELEDVLDSVSSAQSLKGVQSAVRQTDALFERGGRDAVRDFVSTTPLALRPMGQVLGAVRGTQPDTDLTGLVHGFESTSAAFNQEQDRVAKIVTSLDATTAALAAGSQPLSDSIATGTDTLRVTRAGLADLQPTLDQLAVTSKTFRTAAKRLDPFLGKLNPMLDHAEPVINDLRSVMDDAKPIVDHLVPTASEANDALNDLDGPALDGLNGPIQKVLYAPWHGTGVYAGGGADRPLYKETGYLMVDLASVFDNHDGNVSLGRLHAAFGGKSIGGQSTPMSVEQYMEKFGAQQPPGPQEDAGFLGSFGPKAPHGSEGVQPLSTGPKGLTGRSTPADPAFGVPTGTPHGHAGGLLPLGTGGR